VGQEQQAHCLRYSQDAIARQLILFKGSVERLGFFILLVDKGW
jgi:hypothetical protein